MNIEQERSKFEEKFPVPDNCQWCGDGYAPTEFNAWEAKSYADNFKGWMARAALHSHDREDAAIEVDENGGYRLVEPDHETALALADAPRSLRNYVAALRSAIALQSQLSHAGWKEAAIAWEVCASLHREHCKGKDPFFKTRQTDFVKHAEASREKALNPCSTEDKTDAERYRWLRNSAGFLELPYVDHGAGPEFPSGSELDEAIDHARRVEGEDND